MKKRILKTATVNTLVLTLFAGSFSSFGSVPVIGGAEALAASGEVRLQKKSTTLTITQNGKKITRSTAKIRLKKAEGVKIKKTVYKAKDTSVVKVNKSGKITPKNMGATTVSVRVRYRYHKKTKTKTLKYKVRVNQSYKHILAGLTLKYKTYTTFVGGSEGIFPCYQTSVPVNERFFAWDCLTARIKDTSVAKLGRNGMVIGKKPGTTTVTISSTDDTKLSVTATLKVFATRDEMTEKDDLYNAVRAEYMPAVESGWNEEEKERYVNQDGSVHWSQTTMMGFQIETNLNKLYDTYDHADKQPDNTSEDALNSLFTTLGELTNGGERAEDAYLQTVRDEVVAPIRAAGTIDELIAVSEDLEKRGLTGLLGAKYFNCNYKDADLFSEILESTIPPKAPDKAVDLSYVYVPQFTPPIDMAYYSHASNKEKKRSKATMRGLQELLGFNNLSDKELDAYASFLFKYSDAYNQSDPEDISEETLKKVSEDYPRLHIREHFGKMGYSVSEDEPVCFSNREVYDLLNTYLAKEKNLNILKMYLAETATYTFLKYSRRALRIYFENNPVQVKYMGAASVDEAVENRFDEFMEDIPEEIQWDVEHLYTDMVYPEGYKAQFEKLVQEFREAYRDAITASGYDESFKTNMLAKLDKMRMNCLYPEEEIYRKYCISYDLTTAGEGANLAENLLKTSQYHADLLRMTIGSKTGELDWWYSSGKLFEDMPLDGNAYYTLLENTCVFNHGEVGLNGLFFDNPDGDAELDVKNIGYMATTIGHEMGHAFDNKGCLFNKDGMFVNPFGTGDSSLYDSKVKKLSEIYGSLLMYADPERKIAYYQDSMNVVGEAMADLGGTEIALRIIQKKYPGRDDLVRKFFRYTAEQWMTMNEDYIDPSDVSIYQEDVHPLSRSRTNGVASMMDEFYRVFDVRDSDPMYVAPEDRVCLWT